MTETDIYLHRLVESNPLREPLLRSVIQALRFPKGSKGLDAGCGIGLQVLLLAEAIGPTGHVTGIDLSARFIRYAEEMAGESRLSEQISFQEGDVSKLPFGDNTFDWVWSVDCVGYPVGDHLSLLRELARVVKPGGTVAILGWTSQYLLPGYPLLEARLNATYSGFSPYIKGNLPEAHFMRVLGWFGKAGLVKPEVKTFIGDVQTPLNDDIRTAMISLFQMLWGEVQPGVSQEDWAEYQRLCKPESPDFILDVSGYYGFFTYSMFRGKVLE
jgi:ubiquinone/menaquinone biosynthesis C-methylase UbiE